LEGAPQVDLLMVWRQQNLLPSLHQFLDLVREVGVHGHRHVTRPAS